MYNSTCMVCQALFAVPTGAGRIRWKNPVPEWGALRRSKIKIDSTFYIFTRRALCYDTVLQLPYKYQILEDKFKCMNFTISMLENRKETCTFKKIKKNVEEMTRKWDMPFRGIIFSHAVNSLDDLCLSSL